jgi:hypothetical protein
MLILEKSDFAMPTIMNQKLTNYLTLFPFQQIQNYIFAFGMKDVAVFFNSKKKCNFEIDVASFIPVAQSKNHPVLFLGYYKYKKERTKILKCMRKNYGNLPIILMKDNQPGLVLELISRLYSSKIAYTDSRSSNLINVAQYVPATDLLLTQYIKHSKKNSFMGYNSLSHLYMYI